MACGVLNVNGADYIYCVGGSAAGATTATDRVFRYDPVTDTITTIDAPWPGAMGTILPGGFAVFNNKLYILGGFNINVGMVDTHFGNLLPTPPAQVQKSAHLPTALGYIPHRHRRHRQSLPLAAALWTVPPFMIVTSRLFL